MRTHHRHMKPHNARRLRKFHAACIAFWALMIPVSLASGLATSVAFVTFLSVYALAATHAASWAAESAAIAAEDAAHHAERAAAGD